jgi:hypothetical protein
MGNRDPSFFCRVLELLMTTLGVHTTPSVLLEFLDDVCAFHGLFIHTIHTRINKSCVPCAYLFEIVRLLRIRVQQHFPEAEVGMNVDDVGTMALAVSHGMRLARMPCYIGDTDPSLRRLDLDLTPSTWGNPIVARSLALYIIGGTEHLTKRLTTYHIDSPYVCLPKDALFCLSKTKWHG